MKPLKNPRPHPEMIEGPEAFDRLREALKAVLKVKKSDLPPSPFRHPRNEAKKTV